MTGHRLPAGVFSQFEWALMFLAWASELHQPPMPELIRRHFGVLRATAYRYRNAYNDLVERQLIPPPKRLLTPQAEA